MAPPRKVSPEQFQFLQGYVADFLQYTAEKRQPTFWAMLSEAWFSRWPECDSLIASGQLPPEAAERDGVPYVWPEEHSKLYVQAIKARKAVSKVELGNTTYHLTDVYSRNCRTG